MSSSVQIVDVLLLLLQVCLLKGEIYIIGILFGRLLQLNDEQRAYPRLPAFSPV